jgi:hypothetical protein
MSAKYVNNPEHWRQRGVQMRTPSDWIEDAATKATMLDLADQYDGLAKRAGGSDANPFINFRRGTALRPLANHR